MGLSMVPFPYAELRSGPRRPMQIFPNLRATSMTVNERTWAAIPHQDTRILSASPSFLYPAIQPLAGGFAGR